MGLKFSKRKKNGNTNMVPRYPGSTMSLDYTGLEVISSPNPITHNVPQNWTILPRNPVFRQSQDTLPTVPAGMRNQSISVDNLSGDSSEWRPPTLPPRSREKRRVASTSAVNSVIADTNYETTYDCAISFRKGDILQVINEQEVKGWYLVRNLRTEQEGYAHKDGVTMITSDGVESQKFFFKELNKKEAEKMLLEPDLKLGTYLLRPTRDGYALSLRYQNEFYELDIRHYTVRVAGNGSFCIEADSSNKTFSNITDLIRFYTEKPGLRCKLTTPLLKGNPSLLEGNPSLLESNPSLLQGNPSLLQGNPSLLQGSSLNDLAVKFSDLKLREVIGSGQFGTVYAGILREEEEVAVKFLNAEGSMTVEEFRKEAETMHKLRHKNLVSLLAISENFGKICIITERMSKGALLDLLREDTGNTISFKDLMQMAIQVLQGMCYLEKKEFVHRDLRAANVLVGDGNIIKIADFGLARLLDRYYEHAQFYQGGKGSCFPYKWTAPEAAKRKRFTVKSDVWSFGILLYEMVTYGDEPYAAMSNSEVLHWLEKGNRLEKPKQRHCPMTLYNIMRQCWMKNSEDRPNFADIKTILIEIKASK